MENDRKKLLDKVAVITGSDSGMGQAMAIAFAEEGADCVVTWFQDQDGADHTKEAVEKAGRKAIVVQLDTRESKSVEAMFDEAIKAFGTVDILVNDAGIDASGTHVADLSDEAWENALRTNLFGYFYCCRRFINIRKKEGGKGKIINITSIHAEYPRAGAADYDSSKGAERELTKTLALELAPLCINVNEIQPGMVLTPMNERDIKNPDLMKKDVATIPWKRAAQPEEVARLAVYLASEESDYVTGATFRIDGGLVLNFAQGA